MKTKEEIEEKLEEVRFQISTIRKQKEEFLVEKRNELEDFSYYNNLNHSLLILLVKEKLIIWILNN